MLSNTEIKKRLLKDDDINKLGIDFKNKKYTKKDVKKEINVELEHKDLTKGEKKTWKIARAHLEENPNYYDMLEILEDPKNYSKIMTMRQSCCSCYPCGGNLNIIMQKNRNSITDQIKDMIKLISKNKNKSEIFGSYVYRSQFYPSDIDIHEVISTTPTRPESIYKSAAKALQNIVKDVKKRRGIYYGEVKAGIDERFLIDINDPDIIEKFETLYNNNVITKKELNQIKILHQNSQNDELEELIRNMQVIRWTENEILKGFKKIRGNIKLTLIDAMKGHSNIKIDIWAPINGRYIEITNFFFLVIYDKKTKKIITLNHDIGDYVESILKQVKKYQKPIFYNPFKMAKRIWGIARETKNVELLEKLTPLFQSSMARINKIMAEIETIIMMAENIKSMPWMTILKQIDEFKLRLSYIYDIQFDEDKIIRWINGALKHYGNRGKLIHKLSMLYKFLKDIRNEKTKEWLIKNDMWPVPEYIYRIQGQKRGVEGYPLFKHKLLGIKDPNQTLSKTKEKSIIRPKPKGKPFLQRLTKPLFRKPPSVPIRAPEQVLNEMALLNVIPTREPIKQAELTQLAKSRGLLQRWQPPPPPLPPPEEERPIPPPEEEPIFHMYGQEPDEEWESYYF
jgi:hypothetical protein